MTRSSESWSVIRLRAPAATDNREQFDMDTAVQLETDLSLHGELQATGREGSGD